MVRFDLRFLTMDILLLEQYILSKVCHVEKVLAIPIDEPLNLLSLLFYHFYTCRNQLCYAARIVSNGYILLKHVNQLLLKFRHLASDILTRSANFHFAHRTSPVKKISSNIAFDTQRSTISITSGYCIW